LHRNNRKSETPVILTINNTKITDKQLIANEFNSYFCNIASKVCENIPPSRSTYKDYLLRPHNKSFFLHPVIPEDLIFTSKQLKSKNSSGDDELSTKLMKATIEYTAIPLAHIFNQSFTVAN